VLKARTPELGDGPNIPAFSQHGDRYNTVYRIAKPAFLADGVHNFPQQILVGDALGLLLVTSSFNDLATEALYFNRGHLTEILVQRIAGFQLLTVNEQRMWPGQLVAVLIEITK